MTYKPYDVTTHLALHPMPAWLAVQFAEGWKAGKAWAWAPAELKARDGYPATVGAAIKQWLSTLPDGVEIGSLALARAIAPAPETVEVEKWEFVLLNRLGALRYYGHLDGFWYNQPNRRRPNAPHKHYFNGRVA